MVLLIQVGGMIGALPTVGLVILTAICGVWLLRIEGLATLTRVQEKLARGETPETELLEGVMLIIGGTLLLTPGFATDAIGFICLIPGLRRPLAARIIKSSVFGGFQMHTRFHQQQTGPGNRGFTIDGEYEADPSSHQGAAPDSLDHPLNHDRDKP